jgi:hypothetical protein
VLERPTAGVSFETGSFKEYTRKAGDVTITLYVDHLSSPLVDGWRDELLDAVAGSLEYYSEVFGPYPAGSESFYYRIARNSFWWTLGIGRIRGGPLDFRMTAGLKL